ncbi:MAG: NAD(P)H-quinone oxidoreductase [Deltaproteobacteria bacterium]|nr:NAD(P)H-quinone oxidoreductase [Deltaproteobacteria bacterium]
MRAIVISRFGGPEVLELRDVPMPEPSVGQVRVRVRASAVNRADLIQRLGAYPAPKDAPADIPGLEIAGEVDAIGPSVHELAPGDRVYGVVGGGAYAEHVVVHARTLAKMPPELGDFAKAAALPEAFVTAYDAMVLQGGLAAGETALVHAVGSGVGTAAVQIARAIGARSIGTARTADKLERAKALGMTEGVVPDASGGAPVFADRVKELTKGRGADVALELVGGAYVPESLAALAERGRLVLVGLLAGARADVDLGVVLRRRLRVFGTVLRARPLEEKILAAQCLERNLGPLFASGACSAVVDRVFSLEDAAKAHAYMASNEGFGKVVLTV